MQSSSSAMGSYQSTAWFFVPFSIAIFSHLVPSLIHTHAAQHALQVVDSQAHTVVGCDSLPDRDL